MSELAMDQLMLDLTTDPLRTEPRRTMPAVVQNAGLQSPTLLAAGRTRRPTEAVPSMLRGSVTPY